MPTDAEQQAADELARLEMDSLVGLGFRVETIGSDFDGDTIDGRSLGGLSRPASALSVSTAQTAADTIDELSVPLDVLTPTPLHRKVLRVLLVLCVLPLLPLLLPLLALVMPSLLCLGGAWLAVTRPSLLRGVPRDLAFIARLVGATRQLNRRLSSSRGQFSTADYWAEVVQRHGPKEALVFGGTSYTYAQVDVESDRMALWAVGEGLAPGSTVGLLCANRPEHLFCWLGLSKAGVATTLLNTALRGDSLCHALRQCNVRVVLFDAASAAAVAPLASDPGGGGNGGDDGGDGDGEGEGEGGGVRLVCIDAAETPPFARALQLPTETQPIPASVRSSVRSSDTLVHIFTSGTTGLPKAARINHIRYFSAIVLAYMFGLKPTDRLYCCLPMCHTAAVGAFSVCWWVGIPLILAPKFSASSFWRECAESDATVAQHGRKRPPLATERPWPWSPGPARTHRSRRV